MGEFIQFICQILVELVCKGNLKFVSFRGGGSENRWRVFCDIRKNGVCEVVFPDESLSEGVARSQDRLPPNVREFVVDFVVT